MKVVKNNSDKDADKNLIEVVKGEDYPLLYFPENNEAEVVILFGEMAALPDIEYPAKGSCPQEAEQADTSSLPANNESHIISLLKGGLS